MRKLQIILLAGCFSLFASSMLSAQQVNAEVQNDSVNGSSPSVSAGVDSSVSSSATMSGPGPAGLGRGHLYTSNRAARLGLPHASADNATGAQEGAAAAARMQAADESGPYPSLAGDGSSLSPSNKSKVRAHVAASGGGASSINTFPDSTRQITAIGLPIYLDPGLFSFNPELRGFSPNFDRQHLQPSIFIPPPKKTSGTQLRREKLLSLPSGSLGNPYATPSVDSELKNGQQDPIAAALKQILQPLSADSSSGSNSGP